MVRSVLLLLDGGLTPARARKTLRAVRAIRPSAQPHSRSANEAGLGCPSTVHALLELGRTRLRSCVSLLVAWVIKEA